MEPPSPPASLPAHSDVTLPPQELRENMDTDVRVLGIASSSRMLLSDSGVSLDSWQESFDR